MASDYLQRRRWPRTTCSRGGDLGQQAAEEMASGNMQPRGWPRATCSRGDGLEQHATEERLHFGQRLIARPRARARAAKLPFSWGSSRGRLFWESLVFEADMISASVLRTALQLATMSSYIYGEVTFASSQRTFGEEGSLFWRDVNYK